jgi:hypothetical protein
MIVEEVDLRELLRTRRATSSCGAGAETFGAAPF